MKGQVNMRKQNILDLLIDEYILQEDIEKNNLQNTIQEQDIDKNVKDYIIPFIEKHYKLFDLDFDFNINSSDPNCKYKSLSLLSDIILGVYNLIKAMPNYYKEYEKEYNTQVAYDEICIRVLIGNIILFKKKLNKIDDDYKQMLDKVKEFIDNA